MTNERLRVISDQVRRQGPAENRLQELTRGWRRGNWIHARDNPDLYPDVLEAREAARTEIEQRMDQHPEHFTGPHMTPADRARYEWVRPCPKSQQTIDLLAAMAAEDKAREEQQKSAGPAQAFRSGTAVDD